MAYRITENYRVNFQTFGYPGEPHGVFQIPSPVKIGEMKRTLMVIASNGEGWEHVSVRAVRNIGGTLRNYLPIWDEMCFVKSLFWEDEDVVMQLHPKKSEYVNTHAFVLHLWRPTGGIEIPTPPSILVGVKGLQLA